MRTIDADALIEKCGDWYVEEGPEIGFIGTLKDLIDQQPTIQSDAPPSPACAIQGEGKAFGCETCRHHLGAGVCAVSLEMECRDGNYEAWEEKDGNGQNSMRDC